MSVLSWSECGRRLQTCSDPPVRTVVVIQARIGSSRLRGKVLADIGGRPMIAHVLERARRITGIDDVVVAVPDLAEDDQLASVVASFGAPVVRGSTDDVLGRYLAAAEASGASVVVRVTADCPLLSPSVSSSVVAAYARGGADYASNTLERTHPRGLDTEVISVEALQTAGREAADPAEREHVTPFIWRRPDRFRLRSVRAATDRSDMRWTVDVAEDLALVRSIHDELGPEPFDVDEILELLDRRPDLRALNAQISQKPVD